MKTVTANRLTDGRVVYRTAAGGWSEDLVEAIRLDDDSDQAGLAAAERDAGLVVGPYLIDLDADGIAGQKWRRETIRLTGPTAGTTKLQQAS